MRPIEVIELTLDKPRKFLLDFMALSLAEREISKCWGIRRISLIKLFQEGEVGLTDIACILWAGFQRHDPTITLNQVMELLAQHDVKQLESSILAALERYVGVERKESDTKEGAPSATDPSGSATTSGSSSGPSDGLNSDSPTPTSGA